MNAIIKKLQYWHNYQNIYTDEYRKKHDWDCILTNGNLLADTIFSLWLPLRYTLNSFDTDKWIKWKDYERNYLKKKNINLKNCNDFLEDIIKNLKDFLDIDSGITKKLVHLFEIGSERCNVMILPNHCRFWNSERGNSPYYDYLPAFLYDKFETENFNFLKEWIERESLHMFFTDGKIDQNHIRDLVDSGHPTFHNPSQIELPVMLDNYINILQERKKFIK